MKIFFAGTAAGWEEFEKQSDVEKFIYSTYGEASVVNRLHSFFYKKEVLNCVQGMK